MRAREQKPVPYNRERSADADAHQVSERSVARPEDATLPAAKKSTALDRWVASKILAMLGHPDIRLQLWDYSEPGQGGDSSAPILRFRDRGALYGVLGNSEIRFGDLYSAGRIEIEGDLPGLLERVYHGTQSRGGRTRTRRWMNRVSRRIKRNTLNRSAENIHHHYDIGNDFYRLWLDAPYMQYTCAYYPDPAMSLDEAQVAKLHHVCRKLQLRPGDTVVEAGCGWGGLARFMAEHYGVKVRAYNISRKQIAYATDKAQREGLSDRVEYVLDDYRNITGTYDVFVSVGMLEHVGVEQYSQLGRVIRNCLKNPGRGLIHSIGRNRPRPLNAWIERRIFPGAYPPSLQEAAEIFEPNGLSVLDVENLRLHYALTLRDWLQRYEDNEDQVREMHDERFLRAWRLYLAGSWATFSAGELQLFQWVFTHADNNAIPWSRSHQYSSQDTRGETG